MTTLDKVTAAVSDKGQKAVDKAKQMVEVAKLKSQIAACEEVIRKNYLEIGKAVYEGRGLLETEAGTVSKEGGNPGTEERAPLFQKQFDAIANAKNGIEQLERRIREVKGI